MGFLCVVPVAAFIAIKQKRRIEQTLAVSIFGIILLIYLSRLFTSFLPGYYLSLAFCAVCAVLLLKEIITGWDSVQKYVITPGFFFYLIAAVYFSATNMGRTFLSSDEFSHWGLAIKNFYYLNDFANLENATTSFKDYPPAASIWGWFSVKLWFRYAEGIIINAQDMLLVSLSIPCFSWIENKKDWKKWLIFSLIVILLPVTYRNGYTAIYVDTLLGITFGYVICKYLFDDARTKWADIVLGIVILCLEKATGVGLAAIAFLVILCCEVKKNVNGQETRKNTFLHIAEIIFAILFGKYSWSIYLKLSGTKAVWNTSEISPSAILDIFRHPEGNYRMEVLENFVKKFFDGTAGGYAVSYSYMTLVVIAIACIVFLHIYVIKKDKSVIVGLSAMLGGWIIYLISLLILYQFSYTKSEAVYLASFHRYNSTYMVALVMVLEISILYYFRNKNKTLIVCAIAVLLNCNLFSVISPVLEFLGEMPEHEEFTDVTDQITENDKIFFVDQNSDNINYLIFRYEVTPVHINENSDSYSLGEGKYDENGKLIEDSWKNVYTMQDWEDELRTEGYTYVYLYSVTPAFENDYKELFQSEIKEKTLYQISEDGDSVILKKV